MPPLRPGPRRGDRVCEIGQRGTILDPDTLSRARAEGKAPDRGSRRGPRKSNLHLHARNGGVPAAELCVELHGDEHGGHQGHGRYAKPVLDRRGAGDDGGDGGGDGAGVSRPRGETVATQNSQAQETARSKAEGDRRWRTG